MTVEFTRVGATAELRLNRPEKLNALLLEDVAALSSGLTRAVAEGARAILIHAEGRAFCVGRDLSTMSEDEDPVAVLREVFNTLVLELQTCPIPTIAAVQGACVGGGTGLALACHLVIAAADASFASPFARLGGVPDCGFHWFVTTRLGPAVATDMVLTGRSLSGTEAAAAGLIARAVPPADLLATAREVARTLAAGPTRAFALSLPVIQAVAAGRSLAHVLDDEAVAQGAAMESSDFREGKAAFLQKRPPCFTGR